jgi:hypothetical protein
MSSALIKARSIFLLTLLGQDPVQLARFETVEMFAGDRVSQWVRNMVM